MAAEVLRHQKSIIRELDHKTWKNSSYPPPPFLGLPTQHYSHPFCLVLSNIALGHPGLSNRKNGMIPIAGHLGIGWSMLKPPNSLITTHCFSCWMHHGASNILASQPRLVVASSALSLLLEVIHGENGWILGPSQKSRIRMYHKPCRRNPKNLPTLPPSPCGFPNGYVSDPNSWMLQCPGAGSAGLCQLDLSRGAPSESQRRVHFLSLSQVMGLASSNYWYPLVN